MTDTLNFVKCSYKLDSYKFKYFRTSNKWPNRLHFLFSHSRSHTLLRPNIERISQLIRHLFTFIFLEGVINLESVSVNFWFNKINNHVKRLSTVFVFDLSLYFSQTWCGLLVYHKQRSLHELVA